MAPLAGATGAKKPLYVFPGLFRRAGLDHEAQCVT
jgi:hypothetical protein